MLLGNTLKCWRIYPEQALNITNLIDLLSSMVVHTSIWPTVCVTKSHNNFIGLWHSRNWWLSCLFEMYLIIYCSTGQSHLWQHWRIYHRYCCHATITTIFNPRSAPIWVYTHWYWSTTERCPLIDEIRKLCNINWRYSSVLVITSQRKTDSSCLIIIYFK